MAFGIKITNPSGELVLSSDTYFPVYLGRATFVSTTQPSGVGSASTGTGTGGHSTLTFSYAGQIVPVLVLPSGFRGAIYACTQVGSTWTISASYTDGSTVTDLTSPAASMYIQSAPTVFVFGFPLSLGGAYGMAIYNAAGALVGDLTRQPLVIRQRVFIPAAVNTASVPALTLPGIVGRATDTQINAFPTGVPEISRVLYRNTIFSITGTTMTRNLDRRLLRNTGIDGGDITNINATNLWLVECSGLP